MTLMSYKYNIIQPPLRKYLYLPLCNIFNIYAFLSFIYRNQVLERELIEAYLKDTLQKIRIFIFVST